MYVIFVVLTVLVILVGLLFIFIKLGAFKNYPKFCVGIFYLLVVLLFLWYMFMVFLDVADEKSGTNLIVALLAKLGEILVIPAVLAVIQGDTYSKNKYKQVKDKRSKTKTVTTETVKIDFNDGEHYEKTTIVTDEEE